MQLASVHLRVNGTSVHGWPVSLSSFACRQGTREAWARMLIVIRGEIIEMLKIIAKVDGMMCGMCESHVNDAVRRAFPVKKVTSSHRRGETVILTETEINEEQLRAAIEPTGYRVMGVESEPYEKKGLFGFGR